MAKAFWSKDHYYKFLLSVSDLFQADIGSQTEFEGGLCSSRLKQMKSDILIKRPNISEWRIYVNP